MLKGKSKPQEKILGAPCWRNQVSNFERKKYIFWNNIPPGKFDPYIQPPMNLGTSNEQGGGPGEGRELHPGQEHQVPQHPRGRRGAGALGGRAGGGLGALGGGGGGGALCLHGGASTGRFTVTLQGCWELGLRPEPVYGLLTQVCAYSGLCSLRLCSLRLCSLRLCLLRSVLTQAMLTQVCAHSGGLASSPS